MRFRVTFTARRAACRELQHAASDGIICRFYKRVPLPAEGTRPVNYMYEVLRTF